MSPKLRGGRFLGAWVFVGATPITPIFFGSHWTTVTISGLDIFFSLRGCTALLIVIIVEKCRVITFSQ